MYVYICIQIPAYLHAYVCTYIHAYTHAYLERSLPIPVRSVDPVVQLCKALGFCSKAFNDRVHAVGTLHQTTRQADLCVAVAGWDGEMLPIAAPRLKLWDITDAA